MNFDDVIKQTIEDNGLEPLNEGPGQPGQPGQPGVQAVPGQPTVITPEMLKWAITMDPKLLRTMNIDDQVEGEEFAQQVMNSFNGSNGTGNANPGTTQTRQPGQVNTAVTKEI